MSLDSILRSVGKNLFDKLSSEQGWLDSATGNIITNTVDYTSGFIPIENLKTYFCVGTNVQNWACLYDENKNFLSPYLPGTGSTGSFSLTINNPKAKYMRITMPNVSESDLGTVQVELGSTATSYEPYHQGPETIKIGDKKVLKVSYGSKNLFDISSSIGFQSMYQGVTSTISGTTITTSSTANRSCYLLLGNFSAGTHTISFSNTDFSFLMLSYGEALGQLSRLDNVDFKSTKSHTFTLTQPAKLWLESTIGTNQTRTITDIQLQLGNKATEYVPYSREVVWTKTFTTTDVLGNFELGKSVLA